MEKLTRITLLDDTHRPKAPKIDGLNLAQRRQGRRLSLYHNMHREQLQHVADMLVQVKQGIVEPAALGKIISNLDMKSHFRNFGNLCGQECQMLSFHHDAEEHMMFPTLHQAGEEGLRKVVARLVAEHKVVHELIEELEQCASAVVAEPTLKNFAAAQASFADLDRCVRSHFAYEETELEDALSVIDVGI